MTAPKKRLDAFLAHAGIGSRAQVKRLIRSGRIGIDGSPCKKAGELVAEGQEVSLDGEPIVLPPDIKHLMMHKPVGYACSRNPNESPLFSDLLPPELEMLPLQPAGRLDRDSSGLLILTTEGQVQHRLTHPGRKVPKVYRVVFSGDLPADAVQRFEEGIVLSDDPKPTRPALLRPDADDPQSAEVVLHEGRYRQIRRMFHTLGCEVEALHRYRIGNLTLPEDLPEGESRPLSDADLESLMSVLA